MRVLRTSFLWQPKAGALLGNMPERRRAVLLSPGTTASHAVYSVLCALNVATVHYNAFCTADCQGRAQKFNKYLHVPNVSATPYAGHNELVSLYFEALHCGRPKRQTGQPFGVDVRALDQEGVYNCSRAALWHDRALQAISRISSDSYSAADTPYAHFGSMLLQPGFEDTLVLFSERNARTWLASRNTSHDGINDPICQPHLWQEKCSPFDLLCCVTDCLKGSGCTQQPAQQTAQRCGDGQRGLKDCVVGLGALPEAMILKALDLHAATTAHIFHDRMLTLNLFDADGNSLPHNSSTQEALHAKVRHWFASKGLKPCQSFASSRLASSQLEPRAAARR